MRMRESDNSVGASQSDGRKSKSRAEIYSPFKSHFVGALNTLLPYKKYSP